MRSTSTRTVKTLSGVTALLTAAALASCSTSASSDVQNLLGQGDGQITIWAGEDQVPGLSSSAERYEADTGVSVNFVQRDYNAQMISDFITQVPTGQGPDVIVAPHDILGQLVENGVVAPVELGPAADQFLDVAIQAVTYNERIYGLPFGIENVTLLRNNDLVDETPESFDEVVVQGQDLVDAGDANYPILINQSPDAGDPYHVYPIQSSFGAVVFETDDATGEYTTELGMGGPEGAAFAEYLAELGEDGVVNTSLTADIALEAFVNGESPYLISGPWNVPAIRAAGLDITALNVPSAGGQPSTPFVGVVALFVNAQAPDPLPVQDFLTNYLAQPEAQLALFESAQRPPALTEAVELITDDEILSAYADVAAADGVPMPAIPEMGAVWNFWGATQVGIVNGQGDPVTLWDSMISSVEAAIS